MTAIRKHWKDFAAIIVLVVAGAAIGFLRYNFHPATIIMGDSGSLPLGGLLAWMALVAKQELVLPLIGFVFFAEVPAVATFLGAALIIAGAVIASRR